MYYTSVNVTGIYLWKSADIIWYAPERGHGDDGVPESFRYAGEAGPRHVLLGVEHDGGKDDDGHAEREEEKAELAGARHQRVSEDPKTLRVARELKDAKDAEDPQRDESAAEVFVIADPESDVVGQDGNDVYDTHDWADVATPGGRRVQPQQVLDGKYNDTCGVQAEQFDAVAFTARLDATWPGQDIRTPAWHCLDHVGGDGQSNEEACDVVEDQGRCARLRVLKGFPELFSRRRFRLHFFAPFAVGRQRNLITSLRPTISTHYSPIVAAG